VSDTDRFSFLETRRATVFGPWRMEKEWVVRIYTKNEAKDYKGQSFRAACDAAIEGEQK
jgi:hypothetical protein